MVAFRRTGSVRAESLPEQEQALLAARATPARRAEFAAGRAAARAALSRLLGPRGRGCVVLRDAAAGTARPLPVSPDGARLPACVSISHASGLAIALAGPEPLGVDLVLVEPVARAFRDDAFAPGELAAWEALTGEPPGGDRAACAAFAAKEAIVKWLGTGLALPLLALRVEPRGASRGAGRLGRLPARELSLDVWAPHLRRALQARLAWARGFVIVAAWGPGPGGGGDGSWRG